MFEVQYHESELEWAEFEAAVAAGEVWVCRKCGHHYVGPPASGTSEICDDCDVGYLEDSFPGCSSCE